MNVRHDMVTVFVVRQDASAESHEFLQLRRASGDYMGGTWQIIRGGVEADETYLAAALRELREEAGFDTNEFYRLGTIESFYTSIDDTLWHSVPFCAIIDHQSKVELNHEHDAFRWIPRAEIEAQSFWASERSVFRDLCHDMLDNGMAKLHLRIDLHTNPS